MNPTPQQVKMLKHGVRFASDFYRGYKYLMHGGGRRRQRRQQRQRLKRKGGCVGTGRVIGSGIRDILSQGLKNVADKGSKIVKQAAQKHGSKIATSIHKKGRELLAQGTSTAKQN